MIFYPRSPRCLSPEQAAAICAAVPPDVARIGVFVDATPAAVLDLARCCGLTGVQLHGKETPRTVAALREAGLRVIKALFAARPPGFEAAAAYAPDAFLVECGRGRLPGGNAEVWHWSEARGIDRRAPLILAGGLRPDNLVAAITAAAPDAVDVSSGVEDAPGRKNLERVAAFIRTAGQVHPEGRRPVFTVL
jgi:phosphoribosylanthranilate isomerase